MIKWRQDRRCGKDYPLPDGKPAQCNPEGPLGPKQAGPCCSKYGYCGGSPIHCECAKCIDYRTRKIFPGKCYGSYALAVMLRKLCYASYATAARKMIWQLCLGNYAMAATLWQLSHIINLVKKPFLGVDSQHLTCS